MNGTLRKVDSGSKVTLYIKENKIGIFGSVTDSYICIKSGVAK